MCACVVDESTGARDWLIKICRLIIINMACMAGVWRVLLKAPVFMGSLIYEAVKE